MRQSCSSHNHHRLVPLTNLDLVIPSGVEVVNAAVGVVIPLVTLHGSKQLGQELLGSSFEESINVVDVHTIINLFCSEQSVRNLPKRHNQTAVVVDLDSSLDTVCSKNLLDCRGKFFFVSLLTYAIS
jgi:hypothetical protein